MGYKIRIMKQPKKMLLLLLFSYLIVIGVNFAGNYQSFFNGNWQLSVYFSLGMTTYGWLFFMGLHYVIFRHLKWSDKPTTSILIAATVFAVGGALMMLMGMKGMVYFFHFHEQSHNDYVSNCVYSSLFSMVIGMMVTGQHVLMNLKKSIEENERMKQEMIQSQYETLKNQVNPHFLFNSLNTLATIIPTQPTVAVDFVEQMSKVFRYSLQHSNQNTIELGTELKVVKSYLFINEQRYDGKLQVAINLPDTVLEKKIITQSLLMLVENAIKHNEISHEHPLSINIYADGDYLIISNTLQRKSILEPSTNTGLENIKKRYSLTNSLPVSVQEKDGLFIVQLPLLNQ